MTFLTREAAAALSSDIVARVGKVLGEANTPYALHAPTFAGAEWELVRDTIDSGWVSSAGAYVARFEEVLALRCGTSHAVAVVNGTAALHAALLIARVGAGDEVLVPGLTFVATANAVMHAGAIPHLIDSEWNTLGIDAGRLAAYLDEIATPCKAGAINRHTGRRIAAIIPMHVFGHASDMDAIIAVAESFDIMVIEDAAEALGSAYKGRPCGSLGRLAALSFNGNKIVTTGGGGAVLTDDPNLAQRLRHLTTTAKLAHRWEFNHDLVGYNYRLPNINAALGCAQMEQLDRFITAKRRLAAAYADAFADLAGAAFFAEPSFSSSNHWLNSIVLDPEHAGRRDEVLTALNEAGFQSRPAWTPMHRLPMYAEMPRMALPVAEEIYARVINIPSGAMLMLDQDG